MKKLLSGAALFAITASLAPSTSQAQAFPEGSNSVSVSYGFVTLLGTINSTFDGYSNVKFKSFGPVYLKYEHAMSDNIGLGVNIAYATNEWGYDFDRIDTDGGTVFYTETTKRSTYSILARFNYHFGSSDVFDPYIGMGLGYRNANWSFETNDPLGGSGVEIDNLMPLGMELTFGARYFFSENIGGFVELGAAKSIVQLGISAKF